MLIRCDFPRWKRGKCKLVPFMLGKTNKSGINGIAFRLLCTSFWLYSLPRMLCTNTIILFINRKNWALLHFKATSSARKIKNVWYKYTLIKRLRIVSPTIVNSNQVSWVKTFSLNIFVIWYWYIKLHLGWWSLSLSVKSETKQLLLFK